MAHKARSTEKSDKDDGAEMVGVLKAIDEEELTELSSNTAEEKGTLGKVCDKTDNVLETSWIQLRAWEAEAAAAGPDDYVQKEEWQLILSTERARLENLAYRVQQARAAT